MTTSTFEAFGFAEPLARAIKSCAYVTPTPIQAQAITPQLQSRDLMALAETGSGKTAAFVLPLLQALAEKPFNSASRQVAALILAPTRELAVQIDAEVASLSRNMRVRRAVVLGGVSKGPQIHALRQGVHVLVATPGRLLDLVSMGCADLKAVRTLILDEADRMFDMGFIRDIRKIASLLPKQRRTAMFSATMPDEIRKLTRDLLENPVFIDLSPKQVVVDRIEQKIMIVPAKDKQNRLQAILKSEECSRVIVFTRTKRGADRVCKRLDDAGIVSAAIHGNKAQNARQRALADFSNGRVRVLVATDIAARGIDVSGVSHVVNFDMPLEPETYVHRIGRTARKGTSGIAISLCDPSERSQIAAIERLMKQKIAVTGDAGGEALAAEPRAQRPSHHEHRKPDQRGAKAGDRRHRPSTGSRQHGPRRPDPEAPSPAAGVRQHKSEPSQRAETRQPEARPQNGAWRGGGAPKFLQKRRDGWRSQNGGGRLPARQS